jgi:hypothetical protein
MMSLRRVLGAGAALLVTACHNAAVPSSELSLPRVPRDAARFEIDVADDSTATFRPAEARWLRTGMFAYAVDPKNRDALVARLELKTDDGIQMTALVTSQVKRVNSTHVLLIPRPLVPWYRAPRFWFGAFLGGMVGVTATALTR